MREVDVGVTRYKRKYKIEMEEMKGINFDRAVVQADNSGDKTMYGLGVTRREILDGKVAVPESARSLLEELARYSAHP